MSQNSNKAPLEQAPVREGFFLQRPVFSAVISIFMILLGVLAIGKLPVSQYPELTPPSVQVFAQYPGATPETIAQSVAQPIEEQMNGVDGMIYMNSVCSTSGTMSMNVYFEIGTDPDMATVNVNNRVQAAEASLPEIVRQYGVTVKKQSSSFLLVASLSSQGGVYDDTYLSNYALFYIMDGLKRIPGVGNAEIMGSKDYAIRIWLNPQRMAQLGMTTAEIAQAVQDQNNQYSFGSVGAMPSSDEIQMTWQVSGLGRLTTAEEFGNIILRTTSDGGVLRLKDVARVELGAMQYAAEGRTNGQLSVPIAVYLGTGANALETAERVEAYFEEASKTFPTGIEYSIPYNTTTFVKISIEEVIHTLVEAMFLVFVVVYLFLQKWQATLIPCIAVPISLVGTFAGIYALGFSINTLTLFALVLAIGIVVDDAIVVMENMARILETENLTPRQATAKAMNEVTGAVIAIVLVLCAVFIPVAFTGGMAGRMYQQFAITIAVSVVISGAVALTFTPALCALLLKPGHGEPNVFFRKFNGWFEGLTGKYVSIVKLLLRRSLLAVGLFVLVLVGIGGVFERVPGGLVPDEDQGYLIALMTMPDGAAISRTSAVVEKLDKAIMADPLVADVMSFSGMDAVSGAAKTNVATFFFTLKPWGERKAPGDSSFDLARKLYGMGFGLEQGSFIAFNPPPISGMSNTGGFEMWLQDRNGRGSVELSDVAQKLAEAANKRPELQGVSTSFTVNAPQLFVELDREKARTLGVNVSDVFQTMQATFGSSYINDFNLYGRTFRVYTQSEKDYRARPEDLAEVYVRNKQDEMIPLTALINVKPTSGPQTVERFNNFQAAKFMGNPATGYSSGQAMTAMEEVAKEVLPDGYTIAWSGSSYQEKLVSSGGSLVFVLALVMVFLILAAQYESWSLPLTVLTAVPFGVLGAITAIWLRGISNDVYFQVALVTLIGLSAKNAILIVEFAVEQYRNEGKDAVHAAEEAARLRFRPIVMTSLAFILGCVPLAVSTGAGAASRHAIGTSVIGGMLVATLVAPLFVPFFFRWIMRASEKLMGTGKKEE